MARRLNVAALFREAQERYTLDFPGAVISDHGWFYGNPRTVAKAQAVLSAEALSYRPVSSDELRALSPSSPVLAKSAAVEITEYRIRPRDVICGLLSACIASGVQVRERAPVTDVLVGRNGRAIGVQIAGDEVIASDQVVLSAGLGLHELLAGIGSRYTSHIRSRAQTIVALPTRVALSQLGFSHALHALEKSGVGVVPTAEERLAVVGLENLSHHRVTCPEELAVDDATICAAVNAAVQSLPDIFDDSSEVHAWVEVKTDAVDPRIVESLGATNPTPLIIDHRAEGIKGLSTVLSGKFTLAYHTSQMAMLKIFGIQTDLALPRVDCAGVPSLDHRVAQPQLPVARSVPAALREERGHRQRR